MVKAQIPLARAARVTSGSEKAILLVACLFLAFSLRLNVRLAEDDTNEPA